MIATQSILFPFQGKNCRFSHDVEVEKRMELCRYYISNQCLKGDKCLFYHGMILIHYLRCFAPFGTTCTILKM